MCVNRKLRFNDRVSEYFLLAFEEIFPSQHSSQLSASLQLPPAISAWSNLGVWHGMLAVPGGAL